MSRETFASAMRAELDALVARYEALVRAHAEAITAAQDAARSEVREAAHNKEFAILTAEAAGLRGEVTALKAEVAALKVDNERIRSDNERLTSDNERILSENKRLGEAAAEAQALEETFASERKFVEACAGIDGSRLMEAIRGAFGRDIGTNPATYAALKGRGLDGLLTQVIKDRGRSVVHAPLLERERAALTKLAAAAACDLIIPKGGTRFSTSAMDKASTVSEPAEEGNVVECLIPPPREFDSPSAGRNPSGSASPSVPPPPVQTG